MRTRSSKELPSMPSLDISDALPIDGATSYSLGLSNQLINNDAPAPQPHVQVIPVFCTILPDTNTTSSSSSILNDAETTAAPSSRRKRVRAPRNSAPTQKALEMRARRADLVDAILRDHHVCTLLQSGKRPHFRVVPRQPHHALINNYRKWRFKISLHATRQSMFPNAEWSRVVDCGTQAASSVEAPQPKSPKAPKVRILSNLVISPQDEPHYNDVDDVCHGNGDVADDADMACAASCHPERARAVVNLADFTTKSFDDVVQRQEAIERRLHENLRDCVKDGVLDYSVLINSIKRARATEGRERETSVDERAGSPVSSRDSAIFSLMDEDDSSNVSVSEVVTKLACTKRGFKECFVDFREPPIKRAMPVQQASDNENMQCQVRLARMQETRIASYTCVVDCKVRLERLEGSEMKKYATPLSSNKTRLKTPQEVPLRVLQVDGADDSTDTESEPEEITKRNFSRSRNTRKFQKKTDTACGSLEYPSLDITITSRSSPKAEKSPVLKTTTTPRKQRVRRTPCVPKGINALKALNLGALSATLVEESVACRHRPAKARKASITHHPAATNTKPSSLDAEDLFAVAKTDKTEEIIVNSGHSSDLFESESQADEYDRAHNVHVQSSTSKCASDEDITSYQPHQTVAACASANESVVDFKVGFITPQCAPPSAALVASTMPGARNTTPFYSDARHVTTAIEVGAHTLRIPYVHQHDEFRASFASLGQYQRRMAGGQRLATLKLSYCSGASCFIEPVRRPPSVRDVRTARTAKPAEEEEQQQSAICREVQLQAESETWRETWSENSHAISGVSLNNTHGFRMTLENLQEARALQVYQYMTSLVLEVHADARGDLLPDPQLDRIACVFFALSNNVPDTDAQHDDDAFIKGFICVGDGADALRGTGVTRTKYTFVVDDEPALFAKLFALCDTWNADVLMGYEIERASWGYLVERGYVLGLNVPARLSRLKDDRTSAADDEQEELHAHLQVNGRIVLDLWRILKHEMALTSYTFENMAYHVLHERVPRYSARELSAWWSHTLPKYRHRVVDYFMYRVEGAFRLLDHFDLLGRTAELARLFGVLFYEVLSRGSQFRVESMMLRLAKPAAYIPVSPSVQQRAHMKAPEFLPLILEPESKLYVDPVVVLDFQSLYPSIMIAYNYCFATCLGRVEHLAAAGDEPFAFGALHLAVQRALLDKLLRQDMLTVSPAGVVFVKREVRAGILPRMLREILDTRLMVKAAMRRHAADRTLRKVLHSRQLGLKLIANVTYGYTAANFSGRMPAVELADSVVAKGRETLQRAIRLVETHPAWDARVVYGDTDSMFVHCAGRSRAEAFRIGAEIAAAVTAANPSPVRLKLEKVYQPCILQTKKRYVGYMYESPEQATPEFEAKGIETVRRDGCPAASKMLEKCLRLLFDSGDVSRVRTYVLRQFDKILSGRVSMQDLTFAKEYRGKEGYRPGACVPALELARKWTRLDRRKEPRSGERVPYVIVNGPPGLPLIKLVRSPHDLLADAALRPNALYYITKAIIPPINRCFKLIGADLQQWFNEMPRRQVSLLIGGSPHKTGGGRAKSTIAQYFATAACAACGAQTKDGLCRACLALPQRTVCTLAGKARTWERKHAECAKICASCTCRAVDLTCSSLDCPVVYRVAQTAHDLQQAAFVRSLCDQF